MPLIGITCSRESRVNARGHDRTAYTCLVDYVSAVQDAGGEPVLLPAIPIGDSGTAALMHRLAGLVIAGGNFDIPPSYFNQAPRPGLGQTDPQRTASEMALVHEALRQNKPILGICGGMQLLNVVYGGSLHQDLLERPGTDVHEQRDDKKVPFHSVQVVPGTLLASLCSVSSLEVNSTHHQIVASVGAGLSVCATAPDGVVEAIACRLRRFVLGVQWHPESLSDTCHRAIYRGLVVAAAQNPSK